ncbi:DHA2 family efflux MFS transporter permease subunit [Streptomyces sp. TLI_171]|uniref:DHA2 family efflux MFS transporter permease subunit n=1 Tax=Streptomyces sp. TLI_171 TaxID=1938859 RepID=UPI000C1A1DB8|nr:DHA2 family efflux MFS transporter permease subunit [Streptomyces sp. TLI_171]RKE22737.1 EmrB/QacA subfamily drug resistance transporter [Streptomyces sp. TLI_171]
MSTRLGQRRVVPIMAVLTTFICIIDGAITTVALPSIARQFDLTPAALTGVVVIYPVCLGMVIPASAWLVERYGGRRTLLLSLTAFTVASGLCGAAPNLTALVAARALQGLAAGLLMPTSQVLMFRTFSQAEQVRLSRLMVVPQQIAPAIAPLLGGLLVTDLSWRWVFYVNVPFGAAAVLFGALFLAEHRDHTAGRLDLPGLLLCAVGTAALMYGVCTGPDLGWARPQVLGSLVAGGVLLAIAVRHQLRTPEPILRLRLFRDRLFRDTNLISLVGYVPMMGAMFLGPIFIQEARGGSALESGSTTFTEAFGVLLTMQVVGALYHRIGPRLIIGTGLLGVAGVMLLFATADAQTGLWTFRGYMFLLGLAMGAVFIPTTIASFSTVDRADVAHAATLNTVVRQTGSALAPAVVTSVLVLGATGSERVHPPMASYQLSYFVLAAVALAAGLFAFTMPDGPARSSVTPRPQAVGRRQRQQVG